MKLTFDLNCIIAIENFEINHIYLQQLLDFHDNYRLTITIPAISGMEKSKTGDYADSFCEFKKRINKLTQRPIEILRPMFYVGLSFMGYCILGNDELINLDKKIHNILFPQIPYSWEDYVRSEGGNINQFEPKWINPRCDVISMWCHIFYKNNVFVSNDKNCFSKEKLQKLIELGAQEIVRPLDAWNTLQRLGFDEG